jgi:hypothetical protein
MGIPPKLTFFVCGPAVEPRPDRPVREQAYSIERGLPAACLGDGRAGEAPALRFQLNEVAGYALSDMQKRKSTAGPMKTQPPKLSSATPMQALPTSGWQADAGQPKQIAARLAAVRSARAKITRRNSLRKQREALKDSGS